MTWRGGEDRGHVLHSMPYCLQYSQHRKRGPVHGVLHCIQKGEKCEGYTVQYTGNFPKKEILRKEWLIVPFLATVSTDIILKSAFDVPYAYISFCVFFVDPPPSAPSEPGSPEHFEEIRNTGHIPTPGGSLRRFIEDGGDPCNYTRMLDIVKAGVSDEDSIRIEELTRQQSSSEDWRRSRLCRVTASTCAHGVYTTYNIRGKARRGVLPTGVVNSVISGSSNGSSRSIRNLQWIKWGTEHEDDAIRTFINTYQPSHPDLRVTRPGIKIPAGLGHLGASADALVHCNCHSCGGRYVLEVKCPWGIRYENPTEPAVARRLPYLNVARESVTLRPSSRYYTQIQMQLGCWGYSKAKLLIWTTVGMLLVPVEFNVDFWTELCKRIDKFYLNFIVPKLALAVTL